jgi:putative Flp pilus-assembly TadE/G-like protein
MLTGRAQTSRGVARRARPTLIRRLIGIRRPRGDQGAISAIVAIVLGCGVVLGSGALVVDVGRLHVEREELQSGADSAALAVARNCATSAGTCGSRAADLAAGYANGNAKDGTSGVSVVCGTGPGLPACPAEPGNLSACLGDPPVGVPYAEVRTETRLPSGTTLLPPTFAAGLAGMSGYQGSTVHACSRVAWGPPGSASGIAITVSQCNWQVMTESGTSFPTDERIIYLHDPQTDDPDSAVCPKDPSGKTAPGGFGYLSANAGTCMASGTVATSWSGSTGNSDHDCATLLDSYRSSGQPVPLPVYDTVSDTGSNTTYHVVGFGAFVVTGWNLSSSSAASNIPPGNVSPRAASSYCTGSARCLYGYFTTKLVTTGQFSGGANFGISVLKTAG